MPQKRYEGILEVYFLQATIVFSSDSVFLRIDLPVAFVTHCFLLSQIILCVTNIVLKKCGGFFVML